MTLFHDSEIAVHSHGITDPVEEFTKLNKVFEDAGLVGGVDIILAAYGETVAHEMYHRGKRYVIRTMSGERINPVNAIVHAKKLVEAKAQLLAELEAKTTQYYQPGMTFKDAEEHTHCTTRISADFSSLYNEFLEYSTPGDLSPRIAVKIILPDHRALRALLEDHPEYFADVPAMTEDQMTPEELTLHQAQAQQMVDPNTWTARFVLWLKQKRG